MTEDKKDAPKQESKPKGDAHKAPLTDAERVERQHEVDKKAGN